MTLLRLSFAFLFLVISIPTFAQDTPFEPPPSKPLTPRDEHMTFKLAKGFAIDLVASEPDVIDPVHLAFDESGRLFVAEMRGYPNGGLGEGNITSGKIRMLEDKDGDGVFETSVMWAEGLRFPMGLLPYRSGLLVANAPDLIYLKDTDGDNKADQTRVLYTGFDTYNIQQLLNSLTYGIDNWVYAVCGSKGGDITCPEKPDMKPLALRGRSIRFKPDVPGSIEPTSGGGQYGLAQNEWGDWFVNTNSQHLRHIVLQDHHLARNPNLPVSAVTLDIPDHGAACKVFRISPFESWRVERTRRRKESDPKRFASTELVPGGFITSACSPLVYLGGLFPKEYEGNTFVCDPANNLIHRDKLVPKGATYVAQRADGDCEFLASTDNWFRPVHITLGPDGAIYVADFYREVIETPLSLPEDMKKVLTLKTQDRGRIWRIRPEGNYTPPKTRLAHASPKESVATLGDPNRWQRINAQRLLVERQAKDAQPALDRMVSSERDLWAHALWTLQGLGALSEAAIQDALESKEPHVRVQALAAMEAGFDRLPEAIHALSHLQEPDAKVRHQLALTLGGATDASRIATLAKIAAQDVPDPWTQIAVLTSVPKDSAALLDQCLQQPAFVKQPSAAHGAFLARLAQLTGASASETDLARLLPRLLEKKDGGVAPWQLACLQSVGAGLAQRGRTLDQLWQQPALKATHAELQGIFTKTAAAAKDDRQPLAERIAAVKLISYGPFDLLAANVSELLTPAQPQELQLAAVRALSTPSNPKVGPLLLEPWSSYSPAVRREVTEALLARPERVRALLDAIAKKKVLPLQLEPARLDQLRKHPQKALRDQAVKLLAGQAAPARQKVLDDYKTVLETTGNPTMGKALFKKICATCHRLENVGVEVGADLQAALGNKTPDQLLIDILDPSREVDPRFLEYAVTTQAGRQINGLIVAETASSLTLRRAEKQEETILRSQIDTIQTTTKSLMPDGLEQQLSRQDVADVIAYLQAVVGRK